MRGFFIGFVMRDNWVLLFSYSCHHLGIRVLQNIFSYFGYEVALGGILIVRVHDGIRIIGDEGYDFMGAFLRRYLLFLHLGPFHKVKKYIDYEFFYIE